jgi:hypothetical protein
MLHSSFDEDTAWLAGYYEGEGHFAIQPSSVGLHVNSTDENVLREVQRIMGGSVTGPYEKPDAKSYWSWRLNSWEFAEAFYAIVEPWLGERRREQFYVGFAKKPENAKTRKRLKSKNIVRVRPPDCAAPSANRYMRHVRENELPCEACLVKRREYKAAWKAGRSSP